MAAAETAATPAVVEKVVKQVVEVEKIVERPVYLPAPKTGKSAGQGKRLAVDARRLLPLIQQKLVSGFQGEKRAKAFRTNAARVATAARDVLSLVDGLSGVSIPEVEREFLLEVARFFDTLNGGFEVAQRNAKAAAVKAEREAAERHAKEIAELVTQTFGSVPEPAKVIATATALLEFDRHGSEWIKAKRRGDNGYFSIYRRHELERALRTNDINAIAREVAETRQDVGERGRFWQELDRNQHNYTAGWSDFEEYRTNGIR
ncbi:hypothetical protein ABWL39_19790 [Chitinivorax sp. PXF-14]|uniref:hypothetical protein n=1 Tax=Chitinivorax sp. PXF-14 TaxID=3230488 RepID=UPI0034677396